MVLLLFAPVALAGAAGWAQAWDIGRHTDCDQTADGKSPFPGGHLEWKISFAECLKMAKGKSFMYTNEKWPASNAGCMVNLPPVCGNCTSGACGNWDSYSCPSGACVADPKPPPTGKGPPPPPASALVHRALGSHMVLQRDVPARIWGSGLGDITVAVSGAGGAEIKTATAAANGSWTVDLKTRPSTLEPSTITVTCPSCTADKTAVLADVLFGDVFVCGGQSNMAFGLVRNFQLLHTKQSANRSPKAMFDWYVGELPGPGH
jgi:hypothetical protein